MQNIQNLSQFYDKYRLNHVQKTAETAENLALHWHVDPQKARLTGLLHDIGKSFQPKTLQKYSFSDEDLLADIAHEYPEIWHAFIGPLIVQKEFNIQDTEILDAIQYHTTGKANMSLLTSIIFVADYIEPDRKMKDIEFIRNLAYSDLSATIVAISTATLIHLMRKNKPIHPFTIDCRNDYLKKCDLNHAKRITAKFFS